MPTLSTRLSLSTLLLLICGWLLSPLPAAAQQGQDVASQEHLYQYDMHLVDDDFYKNHIPLDGAVVRYIPFRKDSLYGFVEKSTRATVIEPKFTQVFAVYPEGAIVEHEGMYGLVGYDGRFVIPAGFHNLFKVGGLYHGTANVHDETSLNDYKSANFHCYFDTTGKLLLQAKSHDAQDFVLDDTLAWYRYGPRYYVFGKSGNVQKEFSHEEKNHFLGIFKNTLVFGSEENDHAVYRGYDVRGKEKFRAFGGLYQKMVFQLADTLFCEFSDDGMYFTDGKGREYPFGIVSGAVGFGFEYLLPYFYSQPAIRVRHHETERFGLLRKDGSFLLPLIHRFLGEISGGELAFLDTTKRLIGFMDTTGKVTVPPFLDYENTDRTQLAEQPLAFSEGLCLGYAMDSLRVIRSREEGKPLCYYDRQGLPSIRLPDSVILAGPFADGLAPVAVEGGKLGFINKKGELVIPYKYELAVQGAYPFPEIVLPQFINGFAYLKAFKGYIDTAGREYFSGKQVKDHYDFSH